MYIHVSLTSFPLKSKCLSWSILLLESVRQCGSDVMQFYLWRSYFTKPMALAKFVYA